MTATDTLKAAMANRPERPHRHVDTETLKAALKRSSMDAQRYARSGPKKHEDVMHLLADEMLEELRIRGAL